MSFIFYGCSSLEYLPDISKWKLDNVNNIASLFSKCTILKNLSDISLWNTNKITAYLFPFFLRLHIYFYCIHHFFIIKDPFSFNSIIFQITLISISIIPKHYSFTFFFTSFPFSFISVYIFFIFFIIINYSFSFRFTIYKSPSYISPLFQKYFL